MYDMKTKDAADAYGSSLNRIVFGIQIHHLQMLNFLLNNHFVFVNRVFQAGKGRTGLMVSAYLVYSGMTAEEALQLYANKRTTNNQGVSDIK